MGELIKIEGYYIDRKLDVKCTISHHSHGYYYIYFENNPSPFEPDLILNENFINFEGRFLKAPNKETWDLWYNKMAHVTKCRNCGETVTSKKG